MKIEAIITCADYGDYLRETLPHNLIHFDRVLVITTPRDVETQELCRKLSVPYYASNIFYKDGERFNKARGIDYGIGYARHNEWLVHLDADTVLPPVTRRWLETRTLDEDAIYGIDRVNCVGWDRWKSYLAAPMESRLHHDYMCRVNPPADMPLLSRIAIRDYGGYIPIGYFQMWHGKHGRRYPIAQGDAEHTDVLHAIQWDQEKRHLIPEIIGMHLAADNAPLGSNWKGRTTARFGPPVKPTPAPTGKGSPYYPPTHCPDRPYGDCPDGSSGKRTSDLTSPKKFMG